MTTALAIFGLTLAFMAVGLTCAMFISKNMMLGFPCAIFWALLGGYAYGLAVVVWDVFYLLAIAGFGMVIWSALAMYALRTKKEEAIAGEQFIDEAKDKETYFDEQPADKAEVQESRRVQRLHERAEHRRSR